MPSHQKFDIEGLAHSSQSKTAFFKGFSQKVVKTPKKTQFLTVCCKLEAKDIIFSVI